jgi:hypothetical protein
MPSATLKSSLARSSAVNERHVPLSNASRAAWIASLASSRVASDTTPTRSPLPGSRMSRVAPCWEACHAPLMNWVFVAVIVVAIRSRASLQEPGV